MSSPTIFILIWNFELGFQKSRSRGGWVYWQRGVATFNGTNWSRTTRTRYGRYACDDKPKDGWKSDVRRFLDLLENTPRTIGQAQNVDVLTFSKMKQFSNHKIWKSTISYWKIIQNSNFILNQKAHSILIFNFLNYFLLFWFWKTVWRTQRKRRMNQTKTKAPRRTRYSFVMIFWKQRRQKSFCTTT